MDKSLLDFLNGDAQTVKLNVAITRETTGNGMEYITVRQANSGEQIYGFWRNPKKDTTKNKPPPKHTGGRKPYVMLMVDEIERLKKQGVGGVEELIGHLVCLGQYVEWHTGRLVKKRSKKPLQYKDLLSTYGCGNKKLNRLLTEMKEHDLLFATQEGYFVSPRFIKKGQVKRE